MAPADRNGKNLLKVGEGEPNSMSHETREVSFASTGVVGVDLEVGPEVVGRDPAGHFNVDGGLHSPAHGHEVGREAYFNVRARRFTQSLRHRPYTSHITHRLTASGATSCLRTTCWLWKHGLTPDLEIGIRSMPAQFLACGDAW
jgi:hypothetical protein